MNKQHILVLAERFASCCMGNNGLYQVVMYQGKERFTTGVVVHDDIIVNSSPQMDRWVGHSLQELIKLCKKNKWQLEPPKEIIL